MLKECQKLKTIPCEWRVERNLCNAPPDIDCHYAEPLDDEDNFDTMLANAGLEDYAAGLAKEDEENIIKDDTYPFKIGGGGSAPSTGYTF